jgi:predicted RNA-binding protein YlqC (UPF0109 family)
MKNLLTYLLAEILGNNNFEIIENIQDSGFVDLKIVANPDNMGLIIGKKGRMIKALRTILKTKATLDKIGFSLEVSEKEA